MEQLFSNVGRVIKFNPSHVRLTKLEFVEKRCPIISDNLWVHSQTARKGETSHVSWYNGDKYKNIK